MTEDPPFRRHAPSEHTPLRRHAPSEDTPLQKTRPFRTRPPVVPQRAAGAPPPTFLGSRAIPTVNKEMLYVHMWGVLRQNTGALSEDTLSLLCSGRFLALDGSPLLVSTKVPHIHIHQNITIRSLYPSGLKPQGVPHCIVQ